ncbi:MAG: DUF58 domain-containing protein [Planctomycetota bacterium]
MPIFSPQLLKRTELLSLSAARTGGSPLLAAVRKKLPGGGTEVTGHRDYSPGDDFHAIDWTHCARRDELRIKLFEGQSDRDVHLLLDCSPSMGLGHPAKFQLARQIAAVLGYVSLMNLDRLIVAAFSDGLVADLPPLRHASRILRLLRFLEELSPRGPKTNLLRAVEMFVRRPQRSGPVVVISDLYDPNGFQRGFDLLRFYGYDPRLVHLVDPSDAASALLGDMDLIDVESQTGMKVTITERTVRRYRALVAEFHNAVREYCRRRGIVYMPIPCDMAEDEVFLRVLGCRRDRLASPLQPAVAVS